VYAVRTAVTFKTQYGMARGRQQNGPWAMSGGEDPRKPEGNERCGPRRPLFRPNPQSREWVRLYSPVRGWGAVRGGKRRPWQVGNRRGIGV